MGLISDTQQELLTELESSEGLRLEDVFVFLSSSSCPPTSSGALMQRLDRLLRRRLIRRDSKDKKYKVTDKYHATVERKEIRDWYDKRNRQDKE